MTMRIERTPQHTYIVVDTDEKGETIAYEEFENILDAEDYILCEEEMDAEWEASRQEDR